MSTTPSCVGSPDMSEYPNAVEQWPRATARDSAHERITPSDGLRSDASEPSQQFCAWYSAL